MNDLDKHRELTHRIFIALLWLHVPLNIVVCLLVGGPWLLLGSAPLSPPRSRPRLGGCRPTRSWYERRTQSP
jgi:hypothetical protein